MATLPPLPPGFTLDASSDTPPLPAGFVLDKPKAESGVPGWMKDLVQYGPGFLKESGKVVGRAFLTGLANLGEGASAMAGEGMRNGNITNSPKPQQEIAAALPDDLGDTKPARVFRRALEGGGQALTTPLPGVGPALLALTGVSAGMAGEGSRQAAETLAPNSPLIQTGADIGGSLLGGGVTGWTLGPKQTVAQQDIRKALTGTTPEQFNQAAANAAAAQNAGAKTVTAAEMFSPNSGIMAVADKARAASSDNALRIRTTERPTDIKDLADEFLNRILPVSVDPNQVANKAAEAATGAAITTKGLASTAMGNALAQETVTPAQVASLQRQLQVASRMQNRQEPAAAFQMVADALNGTKGPLTNVQDISLALKRLKDAAQNPLAPVINNGATIDSKDLLHAINTAEQGLGVISPKWKQANQDFGDFMEQVVKPERSGPIGSLAENNPNIPKQEAFSKIPALATNNTPPVIEGTARTLNNPVMTGGPTVSPVEIARALAQKKLLGGPTNPGAAVRGTEGSQAQQQFEALLKAGGANPAEVMSPLATADRLQPFLQPAGFNPPTTMEKLQLLIRPLRTLDMMTTGHSINKINAEVATLLADGSPQAVRKLQEIAMFDPNVRRLLTARALMSTGSEQ